jgi:Zn-dependent protease
MASPRPFEANAPGDGPPARPPRFQNGSLLLFRVLGTDVFVHWSWFLVAWFRVSNPVMQYSSLAWNALEYVLIFALVILHEFGHVLACRQTGGLADRVVIWPLGGLAFVHPPARPAALLWSVAAGPLVNVVFVPVSVGLVLLGQSAGWQQAAPDVMNLINALAIFNGVMLVFNLLPLYPLDGGQISQALLWFLIGRGPSLMVVSVLGLIAGVGLIALALWAQSWGLAVMMAFLAFGSLAGLGQARRLMQLKQIPRDDRLACPACGSAPPIGALWRCGRCMQPFDLLAPDEPCPKGGLHQSPSSCLDCGRKFPLTAWRWTGP